MKRWAVTLVLALCLPACADDQRSTGHPTPEREHTSRATSPVVTPNGE